MFNSILQQTTVALSLLSSVRAAPFTFRLGNTKRAVAFDYNNNKVRGVNLGGWFVLEPWITPSIFDDWANSTTTSVVVDEYTYSQNLGKTEAQSRLSNHWNTWIVEQDFKDIAAAGLNHVRIPIGYWAVAPLDGDPYVQGQLDVLDSAIEWARSAGLKVLLDLHGAPGSQNGFDNSGRNGSINWQTGDTVAQTLTALQVLSTRYASSTDTITTIELLNEPLGPALSLPEISTFYQSGYQTVTAASADFAVTMHDAFQDVQTYWNGQFNTASGDENVILDTHQYQVFSPDQVARSPSDHVTYACALGPKLAATDKWTVVGEWTGAQTDCAKWLNGLGKGARYDGTLAYSSYVGSCDGKYTGTVAGLSGDDKSNLRHYVEAQMDAYEMHTGWVFWTWKTESAPEWDLQALLAGGLFPQPLSDRQFPGQCA
ncbi:exo-1,3-beta-glucanase [Puttea exsequens]|nr:exo-1,3-beta-glucanase [Puttea exsequens]